MKYFNEFKDPIRMINGRYGHMFYNKHCQYVGQALELYGEYCQHEVNLFQKILRKNDVVWEIGSNTGAQSVALAKIVSEGQFIGIEPQVELYKILVSNLCANNLENARSLNIAIGAEDGVIELPKINYHQHSNFGGFSLFGSQGGSHRIEIKKIDSLSYLPKPNFIKMDVEGMELLALNGAENTIAVNRPVLYLENEDHRFHENLVQKLWDLRYRVYWHISSYFNENNFFLRKENIFQNVSSFNILCVPSERNPNIKSLPEVVNKYEHPLRNY